MESTMTDVSHVSDIAPASLKSKDIAILLSAALVAVGLFIVVAIYSNPANITPSDPVASSFYP
jgi:hypothetical protein